jgi:hypothetical protein
MANIPKSTRSGGPKTEAGKAIASQNSLKTGIYSNIVVLPGEDESEFQLLENQFIKDFSPQDIAELTMVRELAVVVWKKLRLERLEQSAALTSLSGQIHNIDFRILGLDFEDSARFLMDNLDVLTAEYVEIHLDLAEQSELYLDKELTEKEIKQMQIKHPELYRKILNQAEDNELFTDSKPTAAELADFLVDTDTTKGLKFVNNAISNVNKFAENVLWVDKNAAKIKAAVITIKEKRLMKLMELEMPRRINDDLSRIFFRTLSELRKHQQWRQARNTVDITPKANN